MARWTSPDPYDGSYDFTDPQSLNRYSYVRGNPLAYTDYSRLSANGYVLGQAGGTLGFVCGSFCGVLGALAGDILGDILFPDRPAFHGSLKPRPNARPWDEHGGFTPTPSSLGGLLGIPQPGGCDLGGGCAPGLSGFQAGTVALPTLEAGAAVCIEAEPCGIIAAGIAFQLAQAYVIDRATEAGIGYMMNNQVQKR